MNNNDKWGKETDKDMQVPGWSSPEEHVMNSHDMSIENDDGEKDIKDGADRTDSDKYESIVDRSMTWEKGEAEDGEKSTPVVEHNEVWKETDDGVVAGAETVADMSSNGVEAMADDKAAVAINKSGDVAAAEETVAVGEDSKDNEKIAAVDDVEMYGKVDPADKRVEMEGGVDYGAVAVDKGDETEVNAWAAVANGGQREIVEEQTVVPNQKMTEAKPKKKKHVGLIVTICILVLLILAGAGVAAWFFLYRQSDDRVVMDAMTGMMSSEKLGISATADLDIKNIDSYGQIVSGVSLKMAGVRTPKALSMDGTMSLKLLGDEDVDVMFGSVLSDTDLYIKLDGITEALSTLEENQDFGDLSQFFGDVEGQWYVMSTKDNLGLTSTQQDLMECIFEILGYMGSEDAGSEMAKAYQEYPFLEAERDSGDDVNGNAVYSVHVNENELESYLKEVQDILEKKEYGGCLDKTVEVELETINADALGDMEIDLHIDYWTHELQSVVMKGKDENGNVMKLEIGFDMSDSVEVEIPKNAKAITALKGQIEDGFKEMVRVYAMAEAEAICDNVTSMTKSDCVAEYEKELDDYLKNMDMSDFWSSILSAFGGFNVTDGEIQQNADKMIMY